MQTFKEMEIEINRRGADYKSKMSDRVETIGKIKEELQGNIKDMNDLIAENTYTWVIGGGDGKP